MSSKINFKWLERFALLVILLVFSFLILGAGKVTNSLQKRSLVKKTENERWASILIQMENDVPDEYKEEWHNMLINNPDKLIRTVYHSSF
jgi:hypothetical protein